MYPQVNTHTLYNLSITLVHAAGFEKAPKLYIIYITCIDVKLCKVVTWHLFHSEYVYLCYAFLLLFSFILKKGN